MGNLIKLDNRELSKTAVSDIVSEVEDKIENGDIGAMETRVQIAFLQELTKKLMSSDVIRENAVLEASQYNAKEDIKINGARISIAQTGVKYDYSKSEAWHYVKEIVVKANDDLKEIETIAKTTKNGSTWIDPESGDELQIKPAVKESTDNIKVTLSK